jgi:hypothetical protein
MSAPLTLKATVLLHTNLLQLDRAASRLLEFSEAREAADAVMALHRSLRKGEDIRFIHRLAVLECRVLSYWVEYNLPDRLDDICLALNHAQNVLDNIDPEA